MAATSRVRREAEDSGSDLSAVLDRLADADQLARESDPLDSPPPRQFRGSNDDLPPFGVGEPGNGDGLFLVAAAGTASVIMLVVWGASGTSAGGLPVWVLPSAAATVFGSSLYAFFRRARARRLQAVAPPAWIPPSSEPRTSMPDMNRTLSEAHSAVQQLSGEVDQLFVRIMELRTVLSGEIANAENAIDAGAARLRQAAAELAHEGASLMAGAEQVHDAIKGSVAGASRDLDRATDLLAEKVRASGNNFVSELDGRVQSLASAVDFSIQSLAKLLSQGGITMLDQLRDKATLIASTIDEAGGRVASDLAARTHDAENLMVEAARQLDEQMHLQVNRMESRLQTALIEFSSNLEEAADKSHTKLSDLGAEQVQKLDKRVERLISQIESAVGRVDGMLGNKGAELLADLERSKRELIEIDGALRSSLESRSGEFADILALSVRSVNTNISSAQQAAFDLVQQSARELELSIESQAQRAASVFTKERDKLKSIVDDNVGTMERLLQGSGSELSEALGKVQSGFSSRADLLESVLADRIAALDEVIQQRSRELSESLARRTRTMGDAVLESSKALSQALNSQMVVVTQTIDQRIDGLKDVLRQSATGLVDVLGEQSAEFSAGLETSLTRLSATLEKVGSQTGVALSQQVVALSELIAEKTSAVSQSLSENAVKVLAEMEGRTGTLEAGIKSGADRLKHDVSELETLISGLVKSVDEQINGRTMALAQRLDDSLSAVGLVMETGREQLASVLDEGKGGLVAALDSKKQELATLMSEKTRDVGQSVTSATGELDRLFATEGQRIETRITSGTEAFGRAIDSLGRHYDDAARAISQRSDNLVEHVGRQVASLSETLSRHESDLTGALQKGTQSIAASFDVRLPALNANIDAGVEAVSRVLKDHLERMGTTGNAIVGALASESTRLNMDLSNRGDAIATAVGTHTETARRQFAESAEKTAQEMAKQVVDLSQQVTDVTTKASADLKRGVEFALLDVSNAETRISERIQKVAEMVQDASESVGTVITRATDGTRVSLSSLVEQRLGQLPDQIVGRVKDMTEKLGTTSESVHRALTESLDGLGKLADRLDSTISDRFAGMSQAVLRDVTSVANQLDGGLVHSMGKIQQAAASIDELVSMKAVAAAEAMEQRLAAMTLAINRSTEGLADLMASRSQELDTLLTRHGEVLAEAMSAGAARAGEALGRASADVSERLNDLSNRWSDEGRVLQSVVAEARTCLDILKNDVGPHTESYVTALKATVAKMEDSGLEVERHVSELRQAITATGAEFSALSAELAVKSRALQSLTETMGADGEKAFARADAQREALRALMTDVSARIEEIASPLRNLVETVDSELSGAHATIAESGASLLRLLSENRTRFEVAVDVNNSAIGEALTRNSEKFAGSVAETMSRVRTELETVYSELDRALAENSRTVESTIAQNAGRTAALAGSLSKVMQENVASSEKAYAATLDKYATGLEEALETTSRRIASHVGELIETAEVDGRKATDAVRAAHLNLLTELQASTAELQRNVKTSPQALRVAADSAPAPAPRPQQTASVVELSKDPKVTAASARPSSGEPADSRPAAVVQKVSLSSVVAANDMDQAAEALVPQRTASLQGAVAPFPSPAKPPVQNTAKLAESPSSLVAFSARPAHAAYVSRLIDEAAGLFAADQPVEAWRKFEAGSATAFSEGLYSAQGSKVFADVQARLSGDPAFTDYVQKYVADFEGELKRVLAGPDAQVAIKSSLQAPRGQIYTLLAHALGRLK